MTKAAANKKQAGSILSMTGFGKGQAKSKHIEVVCELKSVNNRFLDLSLRLPRSFTCFEHEIRARIAERLKRGRVEVHIERTALNAAAVQVHFNRGVFDSYYNLAREVCEEFGKLDADNNTKLVLEVLRQREVLSLTDELSDAEAEKKVLLASIDGALEQLCKMRMVEGGKLLAHLSSELGELSAIQHKIASLSKSTPQDHKTRMSARLKELAPDILIDESRLYMEAAMLAEKVDISEELARLDSHIKQFSSTLSEVQQGRKLDFLAQELIREVNTVGSKAQSSEVRSLVVSAKVTIDKIREQVQNVE